MYRVAFDPNLPVVAASAFMAAGRSFLSGDPVDWRALGVDEAMLFDWWRTGQVVHPLPTEEIESPAAPASPTANLPKHNPKRKRGE